MSKVPGYWDTNKGKVLRSIFLSSERTWPELQKYSGLDEDSLNDTLRQLFQESIISKSGSSYWIEDYELYCEYRDYEIATKTEASTEQQEIKTQLEALKLKLKPIMEYSKQKKLGKTSFQLC